MWDESALPCFGNYAFASCLISCSLVISVCLLVVFVVTIVWLYCKITALAFVCLAIQDRELTRGGVCCWGWGMICGQWECQWAVVGVPAVASGKMELSLSLQWLLATIEAARVGCNRSPQGKNKHKSTSQPNHQHTAHNYTNKYGYISVTTVMNCKQPYEYKHRNVILEG